jgi:histidinol-phosphate aminotransferase
MADQPDDDARPGMLDRRTVLAVATTAAMTVSSPASAQAPPLALALNECAWPPSPRVSAAITAAFGTLARYADPADAQRLVATIAAIERVSSDQIVLGDVLEPLGRFLAVQGTPGGDFVYSSPGYTALIDAARPLGGRGIAVSLDARLGNDLPALAAAVTPATRALFLVNPHNPSGTITPAGVLHPALAAIARSTLVIVDEAYIDYADPADSAVALTRAGANVAVFRTFDKIHALAALPFGYAVVPTALGGALRAAGVGDPHAQARLAIAAAGAALEDGARVARVRMLTAQGRDRLHDAIDALDLERSASVGNFVFFRSALGGDVVRRRLRAGGIVAARAFPPLDDWVRVTVGTEAEVTRTIAALHAALAAG